MKAVVLDAFGAPEVLQVREVPRANPGPEEVLIRIRCCGVCHLYAKTTEFGGRIAHGLMGLSLADGMKVQSAFFMDGVALGWTWKFKRPIRIGDTLQVKFRIDNMRIPKSRRDMGILFIAVQLLNQRGEVVQEGEHQLMVPRRPELVAHEKTP